MTELTSKIGCEAKKGTSTNCVKISKRTSLLTLALNYYLVDSKNKKMAKMACSSEDRIGDQSDALFFELTWQVLVERYLT